MSRRWTIASTSILTTTWRTTTGGRVWTRADEAPGHEECPPKIVWPRISLDGMDLVGNEGKSSKHHNQVRCSAGINPEGKKIEQALWVWRMWIFGEEGYVLLGPRWWITSFTARRPLLWCSLLGTRASHLEGTIYSACCNISSLKQGFRRNICTSCCLNSVLVKQGQVDSGDYVPQCTLVWVKFLSKRNSTYLGI